MKRFSNIFIAATVGFMLTGCGLYDKYEQKVEAPADAFGQLNGSAVMSSESLAQMSWREFFNDPLLQQLIAQVLANNTDLNTARIAVEKSEVSLKTAKMAYLPSLYFAPQGTLASFDKSAFSKTYSLPLQLSMVTLVSVVVPLLTMPPVVWVPSLVLFQPPLMVPFERVRLPV